MALHDRDVKQYNLHFLEGYVARIFLSHSNADREQAARLLEWLHAQDFASTFLDFDEHRGIARGANMDSKAGGRHQPGVHSTQCVAIEF
jgi:hypothetical protein